MTENKSISLPVEWPYRLMLNLVILAFIFSLALITILIKTDLVKEKLNHLSQDFYDFTTEKGFAIDDIVIEGRHKTKMQEIKDILNLEKSINILELDLNDLKQKIEALPWVRSTIVKRSFFPNVLHISLTERQVKALWQINETFYPIDTEGNVINADYMPNKPILLIVGLDAPENITELLNIIQKDKEIFERIKVANYISKRRWDIILDDIKDGITIKLPEEDIETAWKKLVKLNTTKGLLKRKLTLIDLRLNDKVIVKIRKTDKDAEIKLQNNKERDT